MLFFIFLTASNVGSTASYKTAFHTSEDLMNLYGVLYFIFLNPCPTRTNYCLRKDYLYLCFPTIDYSGPPNSAGAFMGMLSYKSCLSLLTDSKAKKYITLTHMTE